MSEQYYRVKVEWPIPYCVRDLFGVTDQVHTIFDSRFYTTATTLRDVHLDIQAHLAKHYAEKGLNEAEDLDDLQLDLPADEVLQMYNRTCQPHSFEVEVINDPEQVDLITRAIEQRDMVRPISQLMTLGLIPKPSSWKTPMFELGEHHYNLDRAVGRILRPFQQDDTFDILKELVEKGDALIRELQTHAHSVIKQVKGA